MAVIGQSHLIWRSRVADHISHGNTIVRLVPIEVGHCQCSKRSSRYIEVELKASITSA